MEGFDLPSGFLAPEEMARFLKLQNDALAFYEKHGDHMDWLSQAHDAGLMEARELTPDERQNIDAVTKMADANREDFESIEGAAELMAAHERYQTISYLRKELRWFSDLIKSKKTEAGKGLLEGFKGMLENMKKHIIEHPEDEEIKAGIIEVEAVVAKLMHETTISELDLEARHSQSDN